MKKRFFVWLSLLVVVCSVFILSFSASADIEPVSVELSLEQTFALYGSEFDALAYTSSNSVGRVHFYYVGNTDELQSLTHNTQSGNHPFRSAYDTSATNDGMITNFNTQKYLIYACDSAIVNDTSHLFTVQIPFTITISNIQFFRQRFFFTTNQAAYVYSSSLTQYTSKFELYNSNSASAYSQTLETMPCRLPNNSTNLYGFPWFETDRSFDGVTTMKGTAMDMYYYPHDGDGNHVNFDVSGMNLYLKNLARYRSPSTVAEWFGVEYTGDNQFLNLLLNKDLFYIYIAPPIVSDGFELPAPEVPEVPDYSEQIDNINTNTANISANLAAILAKLDLIYQRMGQSITGTVNISNSSIDAIVDGIKGLFVPSQADILNFRLSMQTMCNNSLAPFFDIEQLRDDAIDSILAAPVVNYVDLPLIDLTDSGIPFELTAAQFPGYEVVDDAVRVPLRLGSDWNFFYELVAWGFDVIATLAFVNMVITKLHALFTGEKVVEVDDN